MIPSDVVHPLPVSIEESNLIGSDAAHRVRSSLDQLGHAIAVRLHLQVLLLQLERRRRAYRVAT